MKSISASIIVLAGAVLLLSSSHVTGDTRTFREVVGCAVGALGLWMWLASMREKSGSDAS